MPETHPRHLRFGPFRLDTQTRELRSEDGVALALTAKAFDTLCCLIDHRDRVVGKDELLATVWPGRVVEENNLTQAISALRRVLGAGNRHIVTVPGRGYRFVADVSEEPEPDRPAGSPAAAHSASTLPDAAVAAPRRSVVLGAVLFALALFGALAWRLQDGSAGAGAPPAQSVAVLPFRSLSPGAADPLLELGLAETLIARISGSTALRVRSLTSSQRFAGMRGDPLEAGRQLGADYVVDGTSQRDGDRVRVNARLLAVDDGRAVWSGTFDERIGQVFTLQDGIAAAVATALASSIQPVVPGNRSPCDGANAHAYRTYLTGRYQLDRPSAARMRQALASMRRAVDLDPTCARAYAAMAFAYRALVMTGDQDPRENFPLAAAAVRHALAIDPDLAEAYASQGFIRFWYDWDWTGAEASLKRAIELNPSLAEAHMAYAHLLSNSGRRDEAIAQAREAVALDPLSPLINTLASNFAAVAGDPVAAAAGWEKALELEPDFWTALLSRSASRMSKGDHDGAIADLRRASELSGGNSQALAALAMAYVSVGDRDAALQILRDLESRDRAGYVPATSLAAVRNALGDDAGALALLERAYDERDIRLSFLEVDARWNNLRSQPRFRALAQRMNLPSERDGTTTRPALSRPVGDGSAPSAPASAALAGQGRLQRYPEHVPPTDPAGRSSP